MQNSTAAAPSPNSDAFAAFLARLSSLAESGEATSRLEALPHRSSPEPVAAIAEHELDSEIDWAALSYESALRTPASALPAKAANKIASPAITAASPFSALVAEKGGKARLVAQTQSEPRRARATIRLTVEENSLVRSRATETGLTVSSYIRACVMEVESLREQVRRMALEINPELHPASKSAAIAAEPISLPHAPAQPVLSAPSFSEVLTRLSENSPSAKTPQSAQISASQPALRQRQPLTARTPEHSPRPHHPDSRVQAALEAERVRIESRAAVASRSAAPVPSEEPKRSFFGRLFGSQRA